MPQQVMALAEANRIKRLRVEFKSELHRYGIVEGRHMVADAIESKPDWLESIDSERAILMAPRVGPRTAITMLHRVDVTQRRRLIELSPRQRCLLAQMLRDMGDGSAVPRAA